MYGSGALNRVICIYSGVWSTQRWRYWLFLTNLFLWISYLYLHVQYIKHMTYLPNCVYLKTAGPLKHICILDPHQPRPQPSAIIYIQVKSLPRDENLSGTFGDGFYHQVFGRFGLTFRRILVFFFSFLFSVCPITLNFHWFGMFWIFLAVC